jgi:integrase
LRYKDERGRWKDRVCDARTKTEAKRLADDLERKAERQRLGLEPMPLENGGGTIAELLTWWLETYSSGTPSHRRNQRTLNFHFLSVDPETRRRAHKLSDMVLVDVTSGDVESMLQAKALEDYSAQTLNHLRRFLLTAFNRAIEANRYRGANPVEKVKRRRVPKRKPDYLRLHEVPRVLSSLAARWRPLFATAVYTGLRKGELIGLRKSDIDFDAKLIIVRRSYDRDRTKGAHEEGIPIADELAPYLKHAVGSSPSHLVFPKEDGKNDERRDQTRMRTPARPGSCES